ncbi:hypothetical protein [Succinimonas sp.]|uniref:hypothetical protein n=1 Tax=Succinimonas sp. TaxID=1936151 RepID=UPI003868943B
MHFDDDNEIDGNVLYWGDRKELPEGWERLNDETADLLLSKSNGCNLCGEWVIAAEKDFDMILEKYGKRAHVVMFRKDIPDSPRVNPKIGTFYDTNKNPLVVGTTFEEFVNTCNSINICWVWIDFAELLADD